MTKRMYCFRKIGTRNIVENKVVCYILNLIPETLVIYHWKGINLYICVS